MALFAEIVVPQYCEGFAHAHAFEPFSGLTSLGVITAAALAFVTWRRIGEGDHWTLVMIATLFVGGIGSLLFHAHKTMFALLLEVFPIALFMAITFTLILVRCFGNSISTAVLHMLGFVTLTMMITLMVTPRAVGFGAWFITPLIFAYGLGVILILRARLRLHDGQTLTGAAAAKNQAQWFPQLKMGYALIQTGVLLGAGLVARAYDMALCSTWPYGLHFVWHILVAIAAYILMMACLRYLRPPTRPSSAHHNATQGGAASEIAKR